MNILNSTYYTNHGNSHSKSNGQSSSNKRIIILVIEIVLILMDYVLLKPNLSDRILACHRDIEDVEEAIIRNEAPRKCSGDSVGSRHGEHYKSTPRALQEHSKSTPKALQKHSKSTPRAFQKHSKSTPRAFKSTQTAHQAWRPMLHENYFQKNALTPRALARI